MTRDDILRFTVVSVAVLLAGILQSAINTKKYRRGRQALLPCIAGVYAVAAVAVLSMHYEWSESICAKLEWLTNGNIFVINILLMAAYLAVKCIACPIVVSKWRSNWLMNATSTSFYEYDEVYDEWFLRNCWADYRRIVKGFTILVGAITIALLLLTWNGGTDSSAWLFYFPAAALIVIEETYHFLNGETKEEFLHEVLGEDADARHVGNFYRIREIYEKLFAPQMLASHTGAEFSMRRGAIQALSALEESEDMTDQAVAKYFNTYESDVVFDTDCIQATAQMMHGKSVVFFNPFYRDLNAYITMPLVNTLMRGKKCLVIGGRQSICEDAVMWLTDLLRDYSHIRAMWKVKELSCAKTTCEVGILSFQQLYDIDVLSVNREYFSEVEFVLLLEPSVMVNTGQMGFSIISEETCQFGDAPVYCICDRYTDGLVDTMSHLLKTEITDVVAPPVPRCIYTGMAWNADGDFVRQRLFDKQTKFLGNGVELAAVAVKNQIPQVTWYAETKAPLRDIKWIAGQHYATICRYMNIPTQQKSLYEKIRFMPNLWCNSVEKEQFIIAEDEFCNMFSLMRAFLSRGQDQVFVNVLSENYLLRDYMRCNQQMFLSNPNAIPSLVPDYAKTKRNTVWKLIILMAIRRVSEEEVRNELKLAGCEFDDTYEALCELLKEYTFASGADINIKNVTEDENQVTAHNVTYFSIDRGTYDRVFANTLKNAYYIVEDEKRESKYIDAKMFGHVTQTVLPGQFVTYEGKYYEVRMISPQNGIILRRASDLYGGRRYYRQLRTYHFESPMDEVIYARKVMDIELSMVQCDFSVITSGYLDMNDNHDLRKARVVSFEGDPAARNYDRQYHNKSILRIKLPDTDDRIRFTLSLLLSEVFRSVFPDAWQYLAVIAKRPEDIDGMLNHIVYDARGELSDEYIYVVEDSDIDLGLLDAVNRSLPQLFEIIADFLDWHFEKLREPEHKDPQPVEFKMPEEEKRRSLFLRMADRIRKLFGAKEESVKIVSVENAEKSAGKRQDERPPEPGRTSESGESEYTFEESLQAAPATSLEADENAEEESDFSLEKQEDDDSAVKEETVSGDSHEMGSEEKEICAEDLLEPRDEADADIIHIDGTDIFDDVGLADNNDWLEESFAAAGIAPIRKTRYQIECYLKFGFEDIDGRLRIEDVQRYLRLRGCSDNALTQARVRKVFDKTLLDFEATNHCDFCGLPLSGVSYDRLNDGRVRCNDCSASAIANSEELKRIFYRILEMMEMFYGINFHAPINVRMADARTVAKGAGYVFRPSKGVAARVLGYAQKKGGKYSLLIENGSPRLAAMNVMVHEMTHIWQYLNWKDTQITAAYGMGKPACTAAARDIVYEGMAMWSSIQYLYQIGETSFAMQQEAQANARKDLYGVGFRIYCEQYPLIKDLSLIKYSPFTSFPPVDPDEVRSAVRAQCTEKECTC